MKIPPHLDGLSKRDLVRYILSLEVRFEKQQKEIEELKRHLLAYENAHTPPSQDKRLRYPKREKSKKDVGAPKGHKGVTRKTPIPTETKNLHLDFCPDCKCKLGKPQRIERKIIEELPLPQPLRVIEFFISHYHCSCCNKKIVSTDPELPKTGNLGNNLQAEIALMKYEDRLPTRKITQTLNRKYPSLQLCAATILNVLGRVANQLLPIYEKIKQEISQAEVLNADETGAKLNGKKHWFWLFMSATAVLFLLRKRRDNKVIKEVLGEIYKGLLGCDGLKAYEKVAKRIQRCWAHLLREAKLLAQTHEGQARTLYNSLCEIFKKIKKVTTKTYPKVKEKTYNHCIKQMQSFANIAKAHTELRKFATLIENGMPHWFTCVIHPEIEPTNNKAENQLREFVIQRRIFGTFRSEKGMKITEIIMSALATWQIRGLNTLSMLRNTLSS